MTRPIRFDSNTPYHVAAARVLLLAALLLPAPARAIEPAALWQSASPVADPQARCDVKSDAQIDQSLAVGLLTPLSAYEDDPFVADAIVECVPAGGFPETSDGQVMLGSAAVALGEEPFLYRLNKTTGQFEAFAWNPWPAFTTANADGGFRFPDEPRFPLLQIERGADGRPLLRDGKQVWKPLDLHRGATTVLDAARAVKAASEAWAGRSIPWGVGGVLFIEPHVFIDFNAFYSPSSREVFMGVVPYRLPGTTEVRILETATSWELAAHEVSHAVHHVLKPNGDAADAGFRTWGESFADQLQMWTQLRDPGRARALLAGPGFDRSNALSRIVEAFGALVGDVESERNALNDARVSTTTPEIHDRSEVMTGAAYRIFVAIYDELRGQGEARAVEQAGTILGVFSTRANDFLPEDRMTLEDVAKAYLKVDAELFDGRYRDRLVEEFAWRELFDAGSLAEWRAHEASLPAVRLPFGLGATQAQAVVSRNLDRLGVGPHFGLAVQSVASDERFRQTIVRVALTQGRGDGATRLDDHGVLVFREDGSLADYHAPVPTAGAADAEAIAVLAGARRLGLDRHGAPLSLVRGADGTLGAEARVLRGDGPNVWVDAFTADAPLGERRAVVSERWGSDAQAEQLERAGLVVGADTLAQ